MSRSRDVLELKKVELRMPSGKKLYGPRQAIGGLYKEFVLQDYVIKFYLFSSEKDRYIYKYSGSRKKEICDINLPKLLTLV